MSQILLGRRSPDARGARLEISWQAVRQGTIVYCALEGAEGFRNRIEAFRQAKLPEADGDPPFYLMATPLSLVREHKVFIADISNQLAGQRPVAVWIDTLNRSLDGSESSDEDMTAYVRAADAIRDAVGCLVLSSITAAITAIVREGTPVMQASKAYAVCMTDVAWPNDIRDLNEVF
jgi:hypothetical protein